jgi:hypothetical protein
MSDFVTAFANDMRDDGDAHVRFISDCNNEVTV